MSSRACDGARVRASAKAGGEKSIYKQRTRFLKHLVEFLGGHFSN